ncbi:MAG TPA: hypothetical protein DCE39_19270 [Planctomycetaceae bacterium]|nr:hypothetical protein [Planctomycetaceae bacterium]|tara:strand:+ start:8547 stop:10241 length:1695 start_codon:yes stop_codon:yes gene_type:complete
MKTLRFTLLAGFVIGLGLSQTQALHAQISLQSRFSQDPRLLVPGTYRNKVLFDDHLAPQGNFTELPERTNDILIAHRIAQQQVDLAIKYLKGHRQQILAGIDPFWNEVYGPLTKMTEVAILSANPISGWGTIDGDDWIIEQEDAGESPPSPPEPPSVAFRSHLNKGDWVYIAEKLPDGTLDDGYVRRVYDITWADDYDDQEIELDPNDDPVPVDLEEALIYRVLRFDKQPDPTVYENVLATFEAIQMALSGRDPNAPEDIAMDITYNGRFHDFNQIYAAGDGLLPSVDPLADFPLIPEGLQADRRFREAGFSNSDSHYHLDRLYDIANRNLVDRNGDDVFFGGDLTKPIPLMWTQDNELPLEFDTRNPVDGATDRDRAFFANRQTVFGGFDDHWNQYVGESFLNLDEDGVPQFEHDGEFYDSSVAGDSILERTRRQRTPAGGTILTDANGNPILEIEKVQESATPVTGSKSNNGFRQWQNIVSSFAEYNSSTWLDDEDNWNPVGVVGFSNMLGSAGTQEQHARDAGNFARFANLVRINPSGSGSNVEPFGKRGQANFNPVVPRR